MPNQYQIDGFVFEDRKEYEKAKKEAEAVAYIKSNTDLQNEVLLRKVYLRLVEKGSFHTVVGISFLYEIQERLKNELEAGKEELPPIKVKAQKPTIIKAESGLEESKRAEAFQKLYEKEWTRRWSERIIIAFLILVVAGMFLVAQLTPSSIFTNYETKIVDQYEQWQEELAQKEASLNERERQLEKQEESVKEQQK